MLGTWVLLNFFMVPSTHFSSNALPSIGILLAAQLLFMFVPYNIINCCEDGYKYSRYIRIIGVGATLLLNTLTDGKERNPFYELLTMINYDLIFMAQGLVDQMYHQEQKKARLEMMDSPLMFFMIFGFYI